MGCKGARMFLVCIIEHKCSIGLEDTGLYTTENISEYALLYTSDGDDDDGCQWT